MCGIHAVISSSPKRPLAPALSRCLRNRGPDYLGEVNAFPESKPEKIYPRVPFFVSTVLSLRGDEVTKQPFLDHSTGSVFCWNGEAWKIHGQLVPGNDGAALFTLLTAASASSASDHAILNVLRSIEGPFAFVYFDRPAKKFYYGRDRLGRRSMLIFRDGAAGVVLSSVAASADARWSEVEADGIYVIDLDLGLQNGSQLDLSTLATRYEWVPNDAENSISGVGCFNMSLPAGKCILTSQSPSVGTLRQQLTDSLRLRVLNIPRPPCVDVASDTRIAILFSGGLDCAVLARISHELVPHDQGIDLINVAFENPRVAANLETNADGSPTDIYEACPDRITGRESFAELFSVCPGRRWRFVAVNIPYMETTSHRPDVISLIYPHNTEMDLSIAYALYFAARGDGSSYDRPNGCPQPYRTPARVLLSGLGADELFGGYVRHATAFSRQGYKGLAEELRLDVSRLGKRNLGRDDRVMAHWGREVRFPYLDEGVVRWAMQCPVWEKCDFENLGNGEPGSAVEPGKRVLRLLALELGMYGAAMERKRAIQFGSRSAKMESGRVKGTTLIS